MILVDNNWKTDCGSFVNNFSLVCIKYKGRISTLPLRKSCLNEQYENCRTYLVKNVLFRAFKTTSLCHKLD